MLTQPTLEILRGLKLAGMAEAYAEQLAQPQSDSLGFDQRFAALVEREAAWRENRRLKRLLQQARLKQQACVEDIDYRHSRSLERRVMASLITCDWIRRHQNLCLTGPTGCGKTWLACSLGNQACRQGLSALYLRASRWWEDLRQAHNDGTFSRRLQQLARVNLLILDDWGLQPLARAERQDLLEVLEDRHAMASTLITSQLPVELWHDYIGDATLADAILDRLLHRAHKLVLSGESLRKTAKPLDDREHLK
jgi:DNA replication protein DnaC